MERRALDHTRRKMFIARLGGGLSGSHPIMSSPLSLQKLAFKISAVVCHPMVKNKPDFVYALRSCCQLLSSLSKVEGDNTRPEPVVQLVVSLVITVIKIPSS